MSKLIQILKEEVNKVDSVKNFLTENESDNDVYVKCDKYVANCTKSLNELYEHLMTMPSSKSSAVAQKIQEMYEYVHKITPSSTKLMDEITSEDKAGVEHMQENITVSAKADSSTMDKAFDKAKQHDMNVNITESYPNLRMTLEKYQTKYGKKMTSEELFEYGRFLRNEQMDEGNFLQEYGKYIASQLKKKQSLQETEMPLVDFKHLAKNAKTFSEYKQSIEEAMQMEIVQEIKISDLKLI